MKPAYLSTADIQQQADAVLDIYEQQTGRRVVAPVPIEKIVEQVMDISILWESIPSNEGTEYAGKLVQPTLGSPAKIVLNEDLLETVFATTPGFERTTLAHEAGHAWLHKEQHRAYQLGLTLHGTDIVPEIATPVQQLKNGIEQAIAMRGPIGDEAWREWQAFTFMRFVLMPRRILGPLLSGEGYIHWTGSGGLYELRDRLEVTISALVVHLRAMNLIRVDDNKRIHDTREVTVGQRQLLT